MKCKKICKIWKIQAIPTKTSTALVLGGLTNFSPLDDASKWLKDILWDAYAPMPLETYIKGKDRLFAGVFCANFCSPADRVKSLSAVKMKLAGMGGKTIWADTDLPAVIRAPEQFLFALKKQLIAWEFTSNSVRAEVDGPTKFLTVEGRVVVTVACVDGHLVVDWVESWKNWAALHDSTEYKTIVDLCAKMLGGGGKGNSKGKKY